MNFFGLIQGANNVPILYIPQSSEFAILAYLIDSDNDKARIEIQGEFLDVPLTEIRPLKERKNEE